MIVDTGVIVAALNQRDPAHERCLRTLADLGPEVLVPGLCLAEVDYWLRGAYDLVEQAQTVLENVRSHAWGVWWPGAAELARAVELCGQRDELGVVDAALLALAETRADEVVASLDHRHLATVPLAHGYLQLLP